LNHVYINIRGISSWSPSCFICRGSSFYNN